MNRANSSVNTTSSNSANSKRSDIKKRLNNKITNLKTNRIKIYNDNKDVMKKNGHIYDRKELGSGELFDSNALDNLLFQVNCRSNTPLSAKEIERLAKKGIGELVTSIVHINTPNVLDPNMIQLGTKLKTLMTNGCNLQIKTKHLSDTTTISKEFKDKLAKNSFHEQGYIDRLQLGHGKNLHNKTQKEIYQILLDQIERNINASPIYKGFVEVSVNVYYMYCPFWFGGYRNGPANCYKISYDQKRNVLNFYPEINSLFNTNFDFVVSCLKSNGTDLISILQSTQLLNDDGDPVMSCKIMVNGLEALLVPRTPNSVFCPTLANLIEDCKN